MAVRDDDVLNRKLIRQARPPASGNARLQSGLARMSGQSAPPSESIVDEDGKVRRLWTPGDPWDSNFYFGE